MLWFINVHRCCAGCLQGRGPAKSIQLVKMSYENKVTRQALKKAGKPRVHRAFELFWLKDVDSSFHDEKNSGKENQWKVQQFQHQPVDLSKTS